MVRTTAELTPSEYESIVEGLVTLIVADAGDVQVFRRRRYTGKSRQQHEIDVSYELLLGDIRLLLLVECKRHRRSVEVGDIMEFAYRIHDIGAHKGLLVTTSGYQRGAVKIARAEGIGLLLAARGFLQTLLGSNSVDEHYWLTQLSIAADNLRFLVRRHSSIGFRAFVRPLDEDPSGDVVFLLPDDIPDYEMTLFASASSKHWLLWKKNTNYGDNTEFVY